MKSSSTLTKPSPSQVSQRPLATLKEKRPGVVAARARGRGVAANSLRTCVEQAGVGGEVGARRAADRLLVDAHQPPDARRMPPAMWPPVAPRRVGSQRRRRRPRPRGGSWPRCSPTSSTSAWLTRLDLPEPDTPVTAVKHAQREARRRARAGCCA